MKPLVAHFTLEPLVISIVSFFAVGARLINLISLMEADCAHKLLGRLFVEPLNLKRVCFVSKLVKLHFTSIIFYYKFLKLYEFLMFSEFWVVFRYLEVLPWFRFRSSKGKKYH